MAKKIINLEAGTVSFDFTKDGGPVLSIAANEIPGFVEGLSGAALQGLLHGISQKGGDSYAAAKNQPNPVQWAVEQVTGVLKSIRDGIWNAGRTGEGGTRVSLLARALHRLKVAAGEESSEAEAQAFVDEMEAAADGKERIAALKAKKKVARMLDTIRLEDAQKALERAQAKAAAAGTDEEDDEE